MDELVEIARWTSEQFGAQKAEAYLDKLQSYCENLTLTGALDLHQAVFKFRRSARNGHRIYWRKLDDETIKVLRILHTSRHSANGEMED